MNLPPKYWLTHYDEETGEILSFHNPMRGKPDVESTVIVSVEQHKDIQVNPGRYRVLNNKLVTVDNVEADEVERRIVDVPSAIIGGLVIDGICYALEPTALSSMLLDLAAGSERVRAVIHTSAGTKLEILTREVAVKVADSISEHLVGLHLG